MRRVLIAFIAAIFSIGFLPSAQGADLTTPPKGVGNQLWTNFRLMAMFDVQDGIRNLRWRVSPGYFVKGTPQAGDIDALNAVIAAIGSSCDNITPGRAVQEPVEGIFFNFVPRAQFKTIIPTTPDSIKNSYITWWYYYNKGITESRIVVANELSDAQERSYWIRVRALEGFGFYNLTEDADYNLFSESTRWEEGGSLTQQDREMLSFYCSTLVRPWDTEAQTYSLINDWPKRISNSFPNFDHKAQVTVTDFGASVEWQPKGDLLLSNQVSQVLFQIKDIAGAVIESSTLGVTDDLFSIRKVEFRQLKEDTSYSLLIYNKNDAGYGNPQRLTFRTGKFTKKPSSSDASTATEDKAKAEADAKAAAEKAAAEAAAKAKAEADARAKAEAEAKEAAEKLAAEVEAKARAEAEAKAASEKAKICSENASSAESIRSQIFASIKTYPDFTSRFTSLLSNPALLLPCPELGAISQIQANFSGIVAEAVASIPKSKKITITCIKGKTTKKVIGTNPKCPAGYKKKS